MNFREKKTETSFLRFLRISVEKDEEDERHLLELFLGSRGDFGSLFGYMIRPFNTSGSEFVMIIGWRNHYLL